MIITYEHFIEQLYDKVKLDASFYYELLKTVVENPKRYTGIFRISNAKTKLIQNVTQSREIKFGDFMEDIVTEYINAMDYTNLDKNIGTDDDGNQLNADQVFKKYNTVYLIEQKMRDDHDSTKKRGQFDNFRKKYLLLKKLYPCFNIVATMWFIDESLKKNRKYYSEKMSEETAVNVTLNVFYGKTLFDKLFDRLDVWEEICGHLTRNKLERSDEVLSIPDFDTSAEMLNALQKLKNEEPKLYRKLISSKPVYVQLRLELFPTETNLKLVK